MSDDPVVEEVRARGRAFTARYRNDANELLRVLGERTHAQPQGVVDTVRVVRGEPPTDSASET